MPVPFGFGPWELLIVLLIVLVIFGASRLTDLGGALGKSVRGFRSASRDDHPPNAPAAPAVVTGRPPAATPVAPATRACLACGGPNLEAQQFCGHCGTRLSSAP